MAERIPHLSRPRSRPTGYPWSRWTDGSVWRLRRGEDYTVSSRSMERTIRAYASRRGRTVSVRVFPDHVELQFSAEAAA